MATTVASRKAKSRRLQSATARAIREMLNLPEEDVVPVPMGVNGMDIQLSDRARQLFPFAVENKATETLSIWKDMGQAETNTPDGMHPLLVFKRNRSKTYACLEFDVLLSLIKRLHE